MLVPEPAPTGTKLISAVIIYNFILRKKLFKSY
jgi:hypothetical protein